MIETILTIAWPVICMVLGYRMGVGDERNNRWPARHRKPRGWHRWPARHRKPRGWHR